MSIRARRVKQHVQAATQLRHGTASSNRNTKNPSGSRHCSYHKLRADRNRVRRERGERPVGPATSPLGGNERCVAPTANDIKQLRLVSASHNRFHSEETGSDNDAETV